MFYPSDTHGGQDGYDFPRMGTTSICSKIVVISVGEGVRSMSHALSGTHNLPIICSNFVVIPVDAEVSSMSHGLGGTHNLSIICSNIVVVPVGEEVRFMSHGLMEHTIYR